jgi:hypothetical protein
VEQRIVGAEPGGDLVVLDLLHLIRPRDCDAKRYVLPWWWRLDSETRPIMLLLLR